MRTKYQSLIARAEACVTTAIKMEQEGQNGFALYMYSEGLRDSALEMSINEAEAQP